MSPDSSPRTLPLLAGLEAAAGRARDAEAAYRRESAQRIAALERERSFAFRRLNLVRGIAAALAGVETEDEAVARGARALCEALGWDGISEARTAVLERFVPVSQALFADCGGQADVSAGEADAVPGDGSAVLAALREFETWYGSTHSGPFWALFDQYVPQTSVVDF